MNIWKIAPLIGFLAACNAEPPKNPLERLGLPETTVGRQLVEDAMAKANNILGARDTHRFAGSWQAEGLGTAEADRVTVHLISPGSVSAAYSIMVPNNCGCVFIQPVAVQQWIAKYSSASTAMMAIEPSSMLAFMLLHELGHIENGDPGQFEDAQGRPAFNLDPSEQKRREQSADDLAADRLTAASADTAALAGWLDAQTLQMDLGSLSWNLSSIRLLDNFGATVLCSASVFQDAGYTHPNLELRMLYVNDRLTNTSTSHDLLTSFENCRRPTSNVNLLSP